MGRAKYITWIKRKLSWLDGRPGWVYFRTRHSISILFPNQSKITYSYCSAILSPFSSVNPDKLWTESGEGSVIPSVMYSNRTFIRKLHDYDFCNHLSHQNVIICLLNSENQLIDAKNNLLWLQWLQIIGNYGT